MNEEEILENLKKELIKILNNLLKYLRNSYKKDKKNISALIDEQQGNTLEEMSLGVIQGLKNPKYTKSKLRDLSKLGYSIVFEDDKYYIIYKKDEEELKLEMPKDIQELCEQLELLSGNTQNDYGNGSLKNIITNIIVNMYLNEDIRKIDKDVVQAIDNEIDIEPYTIVVDTNGAIRVDIEDKRYYLPIRVSTKILQLGALQDEQNLIQHSNKELGDIINRLLTRKEDSLSIEYELIALLKKRKDSIRFIDGRYYIEDSESGTSVELSLEQNDTITELENSIFNRIRDSYQIDDEKGIDLRPYKALAELIKLGFKIEVEKTKEGNNRIIMTSVTEREYTREQNDFQDLDFSELPFIIQEKSKSNRYILTQENVEREINLISEANTNIVEFMRQLEDEDDESNKEIKTKFIKDVFLNRKYSITISSGKYYIEGEGFSVPLTDIQNQALSDLEEGLFDTIYSFEKKEDSDGSKSVVQDVNGYNALIYMMKQLGYSFTIIKVGNNMIYNNQILIKSPTGKVITRKASNFGNIKMAEMLWVRKNGKPGCYLDVERLEQIQQLATFINTVIYPTLKDAEKDIEQSIKFYQKFNSYNNIAMKYNSEIDVYVVYDYKTKAWCTMPYEQGKSLKFLGRELARYVLEDDKENKYGIETAQFAGMIQLLELGFEAKPIQNEEGFDMYLFDPFDTNTGENMRFDEGENSIDDIIDETDINHYKRLLKIAEFVNENFAPYFKEIVVADSAEVPEKACNLLQRIAQLDNIIAIDFIGKKLCFINPQSEESIPLTEQQKEILMKIKTVLSNEEFYRRIKKVTKDGDASNYNTETSGNLIIPNNETYKDIINFLFRYYKYLRDEWSLDFTTYDRGIKRIGVVFPWNEVEVADIPVLEENPISQYYANNPTNIDLAKLNEFFEGISIEEKLDLYNEYYQIEGNTDIGFIDFLMERAEEYYRMSHPVQAIKNMVTRATRAGNTLATKARNNLAASFRNRNRITASPVQAKIGTTKQPLNPANTIRTGFNAVVRGKPHPSIVEHFIKGSIEGSDDPNKPGSTEEGVGIDD